MKTLVCIVALSFASLFAQSDTSARGGAIAKVVSTLSLPLSAVTNFNSTAADGTVTLQSGLVSSGTLSAGATFAQGGALIFSVNGIGTIFNGTIDAGATWTKTTLANGTHYYLLSGNLTDTVTGSTGAFVLQTVNIGLANFTSNATVQSVLIHIN